MLIRFDTTHKRNRHTDRQTPHDGIGRAYACDVYVGGKVRVSEFMISLDL